MVKKNNKKKAGASTSKKPAAAAAKTLAPSFAELSPWLLASLHVTTAVAGGTKVVTFAKDNANVIVNVTTGGQSDAVPCTLPLPVGIFPLHYQAQGQGSFEVTVTGAQLSHPIAGTAPDAGTILIKVS